MGIEEAADLVGHRPRRRYPMKWMISTICFLVFLTAAHAEIFKWVDEKGTVHFTEDSATIPEKYRDQVKSRQTEEDLMTPEERAKAKKEQEELVKDRLKRDQKAYERSIQDEGQRKLRKEREDSEYEEQINAEKEERARKLEEGKKPSVPEYAQVSCSRCNGTGIIWKKTKTLKTVGRISYWDDGPQIATKCPDCNGKGFTLQRIK
jgi:Skp family chaperone for outer membrane proteins